MIKGSYIDISGNRYGNLTAVSIDHRQGGRAIWLCVCDCGNKTTVSILAYQVLHLLILIGKED